MKERFFICKKKIVRLYLSMEHKKAIINLIIILSSSKETRKMTNLTLPKRMTCESWTWKRNFSLEEHFFLENSFPFLFYYKNFLFGFSQKKESRYKTTRMKQPTNFTSIENVLSRLEMIFDQSLFPSQK